MKKNIIFFSIFLIFGFNTFGQDTTSMKQYLIKFQRVVFKTSDSSYRFTHLIEQDGSNHFSLGYGDSTFPREYVTTQINKNKSNYYRDYKFVNTIDTIQSYLPIKIVSEIDTVINDVRYRHSNVRDEVNFSYIMKQLKEPIIINAGRKMIRILYPCNSINQCNFYNLIKIVFDDKSAKIYSIAASSHDLKGIQMIHNDSCTLSMSDYIKIKKHLNSINIISESECRLPGNPWFLEINDKNGHKRFIMSDDCIHGKRNYRSIGTFLYFILGIDRNYFKICAPVSHGYTVK